MQRSHESERRPAVAALALVAAALLTGCGSQPYQPLHIQDDERLVYPVKFVCNELDPFANVVHWTEVNTLNPSSEVRARVTKKFVAARTQANPTLLKPYSEGFYLDRNEALAITCDEILDKLGLPLTTGLEGFVEIVADLRLGVTGVYDKCVPQVRTDTFMYSLVTGKLRFAGSESSQPVRLQGPAVIKKEPVEVNWEKCTFVVRTEIESMQLAGAIDAGGREVAVEMIKDPTQAARGLVAGKVDCKTGKLLMPAYSRFFVPVRIVPAGPDPEFRERFGEYLFGETVVEALITSLPPGGTEETIPAGAAAERAVEVLRGIGEVVRGTDGSIVGADLHGDPPVNTYCASQAQGPLQIFSASSPQQPVAQITDHCHGPKPPPPPAPPKRPKLGCQTASIDVENVEPTIAKVGQVLELPPEPLPN